MKDPFLGLQFATIFYTFCSFILVFQVPVPPLFHFMNLTSLTQQFWGLKFYIMIGFCIPSFLMIAVLVHKLKVSNVVAEVFQALYLNFGEQDPYLA